MVKMGKKGNEREMKGKAQALCPRLEKIAVLTAAAPLSSPIPARFPSPAAKSGRGEGVFYGFARRCRGGVSPAWGKKWNKIGKENEIKCEEMVKSKGTLIGKK